MKRKKSESQIAKVARKYGVSERCARYWAKETDISNPAKLSAYLARRRQPPRRAVAGTKVKASVDTKGLVRGAAAATRRAEELEVRSFAELQQAIESRDPLRIRLAHDV